MGQREIEMKKSDFFLTLQKQWLYFSAGIMRDDVSNYVMVCETRVWKKDESLHTRMNGFCEEGGAVQVSLGNIANWPDIRKICENLSGEGR